MTLKQLLRWLDDNILLVLGGFLLAFIPLWPKIPLFSPIEQYIVRVRAEDIVVFFAALVWVIQVVRKKVAWRSTMFWLVAGYALVGALSVITAVFVTKTIPLQPLHVGKTLLHYFRYLEYFSIFFILFAAIKKKSDVMVLLSVFALTVIGISAYGFGQKYYYWPVYSTMNREFSKGVRLILTPHARVQSTFAGHYDMGAFLVIALPMLLALLYRVRETKKKILLYVAYWVGTWLLIVSASRTSFLAFIAGVALVIGLTALQRENWFARAKFAVSRTLVVLLFTGLIFVFFGQDLTERLNQVLNSNQQWHDTFHAWNKQRKEFVNTLLGKATLTAPTPPPNSITTDEALQMGILTPTDEQPIPVRPSDVYVDVPDIQRIATISATGETIYTEVNKGPRTYSDNAIKYGLSLAIRLDTLWPRAIQGFASNPLLGKGYATLNKESVEQFTEAESTDNNFLRTLGETGLLGFITFYGCVLLIMSVAVRELRRGDRTLKALSVGILGASIGILINAAYIDVFASSKVAFTYWALAGIFLAYSFVVMNSHHTTEQVPPAKPTRSSRKKKK